LFLFGTILISLRNKTMNQSTKITIDLSKELTEEELASFKRKAAQSGAKSLKEHFLNITIKKEVA